MGLTSRRMRYIYMLRRKQLPCSANNVAKKRPMRKKTLCLLLGLLLVPAACQKEKQAAKAPPPPKVQVVVTKSQDVPLYQEFVGQVYGMKDIAIRARVEGFLESIHFKEGSHVKKGALLYVLESQPFEADVAAKMSRVAEAKTMLAKAKSDLGRIRPLAAEKAVSQSDLDGAVAQYEAAIASVEAARANLRAAKIQLGYTKIYAPISGIIGKTQAKVGDFVGRSPNPVILNTVSRIDTILVQFFITERQYLHIARRYNAANPSDHPNDAESPLDLILADGSVYEHKGKIDFVNREVDPTTGAMLVQASFPNPDEILRPGQFAKVKALVRIVKNGILVPQRCVTELQGRYSVYVVDKDNKAQSREIQAGPKVGSFWLISKGLKLGEKVIYEGLQQVKNGMLVNPIVQEVKEVKSADPESK